MTQNTLFKEEDDYFTACAQGDVAVLRNILAQTPFVVDWSADGWLNFCGLHFAAANGHTACIDLLIAADAEVDALDKNGCTPLFQAIRAGHLPAARLLLNHQADPNLANEQGESALFYAAMCNQAKMIPLLLEYGAAADEPDRHGFNLHAWALLMGRQDVTDALQQHHAAEVQADVDLMHQGAQQNIRAKKLVLQSPRRGV